MDRWGVRHLLEELLVTWTDSWGDRQLNKCSKESSGLAPKTDSMAGSRKRIRAHRQKRGPLFYITFED